MRTEKEITIIAEHKDNRLNTVTRELIAKAKELAEELDYDVSVLALGDEISEVTEQICRYTPDRIFYIEDKKLGLYNTDAYTAAITEYLQRKKPDIVLIGATHQGRDLAPRLAARNRTGLTADCTGLETDENKNLLMTRPAFGGNLMATITCEKHRPQMATVRPGVFHPEEPVKENLPEPERLRVSFEDIKIRGEVLEQIKEKKSRENISESEVLIAGGRGMGGKKGFKTLKELAGLMNGTIAASRPVIDQGWVDKAFQVGQTGKTVRPRLYIACGISGALQHIAGMQESDFIIAINKNEDAPIMKIADLAIVGDVHKIIPEMIERLRKE